MQKTTFGAVIKGLRVHSGMNIPSVAMILGLKPEILEQLEGGTSEYTLATLPEVDWKGCYGADPLIVLSVLNHLPEDMPEGLRDATRRLVDVWREELIANGFLAEEG